MAYGAHPDIPQAPQRTPSWDPAPQWTPYGAYQPVPVEPRPRPASAASWALAASVVAVALSLCVGGLIPGLIGLALARMATAEVAASGGWLTGAGMIKAARVLSLVAIAVSVVIGVVLVDNWLFGLGVDVGDAHYPSSVN
ncbi:hypothetical protein [Fodinicola acaciae]|uniref:hypothetical protein n=1 Tax=Fodinicola acaciae TaxID=2681555 RepID=UPI0013D7AFE5|nr:hypothetical protein [Fodinicola acaciae]